MPSSRHCDDVGFVLQAAAAGVDQDRRAERAVAVEFGEQIAIEDVPRLRRQRQQADQDVGPSQECSSCAFAVKAFDAVDLLPGCGSSPTTSKADAAAATSAALAPSVPSPMMPTEIAPAGHCVFRRPALFALAIPQIKLLPVMHQHMQHDIFGHPLGEVVDGDADQRHIGQRAVRHQRIDAGAEIEDHPQIGKRGELARTRLPDRGIMHLGRIERRIRQQQHAPVAADLVEPLFQRCGDQFSVPPWISSASAPLFIVFGLFRLKLQRDPTT